MQVTGSCLCRAIEYSAKVDPDTTRICHCSDCQRNSGSAFGTVISIHLNDFELLKGQPRFFVKTADSGAQRKLAFCADCGTRIYSASADPSNPSAGLRVGTIDQSHQLKPAYQIWTRSSQTWLDELSEMPKFDTVKPQGSR